MWRFKGHSMVILNCGIPTIMLELTLISFCNIVNQITLHLKESRTRDLQLIFCILNLYTMQQLAFSPGSREDGMYVHVCVCYVCSWKSSSAFSPFTGNWKSLFLIFSMISCLLSFSSMILKKPVGVFVPLAPLYHHFENPVCLSVLNLTFQIPQHVLWTHRHISKHGQKPCPGNILQFL